jgi:hypothetical protein
MGAAAVAAWAMTASAAGQTGRPGASTYVPPRTLFGAPDLQGIWQVRNTAWGDIQDHVARLATPAVKDTPFLVGPMVPAGRGVVEGNEIPYQPWAAAKKTENFENRFTADPLARCYLPGVPRATYLQTPLQIVQTPKYVTINYEYSHSWRIVYTDGSPHVNDINFWMGDSRGKYDGNTLVVDAANFNDQTWFDMAGNFHSDALHVVERYTRTGRDTMRYEAIIEDPKVFTRTWKMSMLVYRHTEPDARLLEYECAVAAEEYLRTFPTVGTFR